MKYIQNKFSSHEEQEIFREEIKVRKKRGYPDGKLKIKKSKGLHNRQKLYARYPTAA